MDIDVPELVRQRAQSNGAAGSAWLADLPDALDALAERWGLTLGASFGGGTAGCVVEARDADGSPCVLKLAMPLDASDVAAFERSVIVHEIAAGQGCAELLASDTDMCAMLLERLGPNLDDLEYSVPQILDAVTTTLREFWRPAPEDDRLPTGAEKAAWLSSYITSTWDDLARPCPRAVIDRAVAYCDERAAAHRPADAVLVHGDAHGWNTVVARGDHFKFVDPEGVRSEPAHDLSVPMREYNEPLLAGDTRRLTRERAEYLAQRCGIDPEPVWQWGYIERVSTGLAALRDFEGDIGLRFLEVAERCR